jgi:hypothetical protein
MAVLEPACVAGLLLRGHGGRRLGRPSGLGHLAVLGVTGAIPGRLQIATRNANPIVTGTNRKW